MTPFGFKASFALPRLSILKIYCFCITATISLLFQLPLSAAQLELTGLAGYRNSPISRLRSRPNQSDGNDYWYGVKLKYADSLSIANTDAELYWDVIAFVEKENVYSSFQPLLNIQELFITKELGDSCILNIGRLNIANGISGSYRPVDYFRDSAIVLNESFSLRDQIQNRIGQVGMQLEVLQEKVTWDIFLSPKIETLSETSNSKNRFLLKMIPESGENLYTEFFLFLDDDSKNLGGTLSYKVLKNMLGYLEYNVSDYNDVKIINHSDNQVEYSEVDDDYNYQFVLGMSLQAGKRLLARLEYIYFSDRYNSEQSGDYYDLIAIKDKTNPNYFSALDEYPHVFASQQYLSFEFDYYISSSKLRVIPIMTYNLQDQSYSTGFNLNCDISDHFNLFFRSYFRMGKERSEFGSAPDHAVIFTGIRYSF